MNGAATRSTVQPGHEAQLAGHLAIITEGGEGIGRALATTKQRSSDSGTKPSADSAAPSTTTQ